MNKILISVNIILLSIIITSCGSMHQPIIDDIYYFKLDTPIDSVKKVLTPEKSLFSITSYEKEKYFEVFENIELDGEFVTFDIIEKDLEIPNTTFKYYYLFANKKLYFWGHSYEFLKSNDPLVLKAAKYIQKNIYNLNKNEEKERIMKFDIE